MGTTASSASGVMARPNQEPFRAFGALLCVRRARGLAVRVESDFSEADTAVALGLEGAAGTRTVAVRVRWSLACGHAIGGRSHPRRPLWRCWSTPAFGDRASSERVERPDAPEPERIARPLSRQSVRRRPARPSRRRCASERHGCATARKLACDRPAQPARGAGDGDYLALSHVATVRRSETKADVAHRPVDYRTGDPTTRRTRALGPLPNWGAFAP